ncbi:hypothetical protein EZV62_001886 [Acer yangbiense]|uniref:Uncharacterized protein n=1 Tax=Acer yangbiense TaxID=1000413 RepID=A0A5C7IVG1_9ROSI|nr:hypothetical protein EZV62_001886 [Acer yangbiense]
MCIKAVGRKTHHSKVEMRKPDLQVSGGIGNMIKLRKGLWSPEEDEKLMSYMVNNGQGCWSDVARNAGLQRCGKSCRLRWINYLRPDLKRASMVLNHMMMDVQLPVLEHGMNMFHENHHHGYDPSPCMAQVGMSGGGGCFYGEQGYFGEIYVPPLESVSKEENVKTENNHRNTNNNNQLVNNTNIVNDNDKAENVTDGVGNFSWQEEEEIKLGEWDLEELMKDVSSTPFFDMYST